MVGRLEQASSHPGQAAESGSDTDCLASYAWPGGGGGWLEEGVDELAGGEGDDEGNV